MSIANSTNYASVKDGSGGAVPIMQWATLDSDQFNRTHVADTAQTLEWHVHGGKAQGTGLSVLNLNSSASTNTALTNAGDVLITASHFTYNDGSNVAHTVAQLDGTNTYATGAVQDFSAQTGVNSFKVPVAAGFAPTQSGAIGYNSTNNTFVVGANGSTQTLLVTGGSALGVASGGTGLSAWTNANVFLFSGSSSTGAMNSTFTAGSANQVIHSNGGGSYSWGSVTGSDIANGTITSANLAAGAVSGSLATFSSLLGAINPITGTNTAGGVALSVRIDGGSWTRITGYPEIAGDNNQVSFAGAYSFAASAASHTIDLAVDTGSDNQQVIATDTKTTHGGTIYIVAAGSALSTGSGGSGLQATFCSFIGFER